MDDGSDGSTPSGRGGHQQQLVHALRGACGAPCAEALGSLTDGDDPALWAARSRGSALAAAIAQAQLALALGMNGDLAGARRVSTSAAALLARAPEGAVDERRSALLWLGVVEWAVLGDVRCARDRFARATVISLQDARDEIAVPTLALRALASTHAGDLAGAMRTARDALRRAHAAGDPALLAIAHAAQLQQFAARGERDAALREGERLLGLRAYVGTAAHVAGAGEAGAGDDERDTHAAGAGDAEPDPTPASPLREQLDAIAAWAVAPLLLDVGETARAAELVSTAATPRRLARLLPQARATLLGVRVRAAVALDDATAAHRLLHALEQQAFARTPLGAAVAGCAAALVALADDRPLNAEARATAAAEHARRAPSRQLELRATVLAGHAQAALGAPEVAAERFAEADAIAVASGGRAPQAVASRWPAGVDDEPAEAHGLTPRQFQIARLVADGATNRQVASTLGISEHTVNTHLRVAFARLGVTRRTALRSALEQSAARARSG